VVAGLERQHELADQVDRLEEAQAVAHMGSYDWDITTDTNRWSDELYRIYGYEPQSFNASYDRFMSMLHPDDRDLVRKVHEQAYATGEPYHTIERIIRPTGEERVLDTTGRVIRDHTGTPVRMAGVCMDITERWHAEREAERVAERQRQALQINDNVLQGLAVALYALDGGDAASARHATASTLALARQLVHDLLASAGPTHLEPGALVRDHAAPAIATADVPPAPDLVAADSDTRSARSSGSWWSTTARTCACSSAWPWTRILPSRWWVKLATVGPACSAAVSSSPTSCCWICRCRSWTGWRPCH
jgi:PAS domain S-box-containing protein